MNEVTIKRSSQENTGWTKNITFERKGKTHTVILTWDNWEGYDITFENKTNSTPIWACNMIENYDGDENLYEILDNLTSIKGN